MASSFSSDSDITDKVDALIAEATDLCALETVAALNTAHLSSSSLPSNLETRFHKLKSFDSFPPTTHEKKENTHGSCSTPQLSESELDSFEDLKPEQPAKAEAKEVKQRRGSPHPPSRSPSPPQRQTCGCFSFASPKRVVQKKGRSNNDNVGDDDDILSGFGSESMKESRRKLKKAWSEHEKASREAEKMVKWVKQVSARINEAAIDELMKEEFK